MATNQKAYLVRHQHGHVNEQVVFLKPPTDEQVKAVLSHDDERYGKCDASWSQQPARVMEVTLITDSTVPNFEKAPEKKAPEKE